MRLRRSRAFPTTAMIGAATLRVTALPLTRFCDVTGSGVFGSARLGRFAVLGHLLLALLIFRPI